MGRGGRTCAAGFVRRACEGVFVNDVLTFSQNRRVVVLPPETATKVRILNAVDRPLESLTVKQICEACGIARSTFYSHFESKFDLFPWLLESTMRETLDLVGRTLTWRQGIEGYLELLGYASRFTRLAAEPWRPASPLAQHRRAAIAQTLAQRGVRPTAEQRLLVELYVDAEARFCLKWFAGELPLEGQTLARLFEEQVPTWLHEALEPARRPVRLLA